VSAKETADIVEYQRQHGDCAHKDQECPFISDNPGVCPWVADIQISLNKLDAIEKTCAERIETIHKLDNNMAALSADNVWLKRYLKYQTFLEAGTLISVFAMIGHFIGWF
jgi:hypothetical protein